MFFINGVLICEIFKSEEVVMECMKCLLDNFGIFVVCFLIIGILYFDNFSFVLFVLLVYILMLCCCLFFKRVCCVGCFIVDLDFFVFGNRSGVIW